MRLGLRCHQPLEAHPAFDNSTVGKPLLHTSNWWRGSHPLKCWALAVPLTGSQAQVDSLGSFVVSPWAGIEVFLGLGFILSRPLFEKIVMKKNEKISRNERCPATGKKYKHCCGAL